MGTLKNPDWFGPTETGPFKLVQSSPILASNSVWSDPKYYKTEVTGPIQI